MTNAELAAYREQRFRPAGDAPVDVSGNQLRSAA
jgi:hypothetical protein